MTDGDHQSSEGSVFVRRSNAQRSLATHQLDAIKKKSCKFFWFFVELTLVKFSKTCQKWNTTNPTNSRWRAVRFFYILKRNLVINVKSIKVKLCFLFSGVSAPRRSESWQRRFDRHRRRGQRPGSTERQPARRRFGHRLKIDQKSIKNWLKID